jgi:hypothetical protein
MATPFGGITVRGASESRRDEVLAGPQQQTVQTRFKQHARVPFRGAERDDEAEASLATNSVPAIAMMAIREGRRWWRTLVIAIPMKTAQLTK